MHQTQEASMLIKKKRLPDQVSSQHQRSQQNQRLNLRTQFLLAGRVLLLV
uniref:Calpastatin n=1 Tax=Molossus molossus TaxID=27622 RepID=A0A7J8IWC0_MOLMO|nr:calpastatin [Molossus molossus]